MSKENACTSIEREKENSGKNTEAKLGDEGEVGKTSAAIEFKVQKEWP